MKRYCKYGLSLLLLVGTAVITMLPQMDVAAADDVYQDRFLEMWGKLHDSNNGYFSPEGIPYHTRENLLCEAPDIGHESVSETISYWVWLEALYGKFQGDWQPFKKTWEITEKYFIPSPKDQLESSLAKIKTNHPSDYAPEMDLPQEYPAKLDFNKSVGSDPLHNELYSTYGNNQVYGMHWIIDVDNWFGYGQRDDGVSRPVYVNTFQRGCQESCWETVTHPCWLDKYKALQNIYVAQPDGQSAPAQWRYTNAPDADARQIQATYWAYQWAKDQGVDLSAYASKAAKMGDYLRYALFDKFFMKIGSGVTGGSPASGYDSCHYLISWYYAWGGAIDGSWGWIQGCSHNHQAYQNPLAAYVLSNVSAFIPKSPTAAQTWATSMTRQVEFYQWLQSAEGAIAGGATNSFNGRYEAIPSGMSTFYGMAYDWQPVWHDPPSNRWFGYQTWPMQRLAEYYYVTGDSKAKLVLDKWVKWAKGLTTVNGNSFRHPSHLSWSGQPDTWSGTAPANNNLHCTVTKYGQEIGTAGSLANTFLFYAAGLRKHNESEYASAGYPVAELAKQLLDVIWNNFRDAYGVSTEESIEDYNRYFNQEVYVPTNVNVTLPNGDVVKNGVKFIDIRSKLKQDSEWSKIAAYQSGGAVPTFKYHRWWHEVDYAMALGIYSLLGPWGPSVTPTPTDTATPTPSPTPTITPTDSPSPSPTPSPSLPSGDYTVSYSQNDWGSGATVTLTIKNNSATAIEGWTLAWNFPNNQTIANLWCGSFTQSGSSVVVSNLNYNSYIPAGGTAVLGFNLSYSGANTKPTQITLNGVPCTVN